MSVILGANGIFDPSQVRSGSRALYRPLSASVLSRPDVSSAEVSGLFICRCLTSVTLAGVNRHLNVLSAVNLLQTSKIVSLKLF